MVVIPTFCQYQVSAVTEVIESCRIEGCRVPVHLDQASRNNGRVFAQPEFRGGDGNPVGMVQIWTTANSRENE